MDKIHADCSIEDAWKEFERCEEISNSANNILEAAEWYRLKYNNLVKVLIDIKNIEARTPRLRDDYNYEDVAILDDNLDEIFGIVNTTLYRLER